jgi:hypothetical protein
MVNFSGVLTDVNGKPLTGVAGVTFNLYKDSQGGVPLWSETQNVWPNSTGHYSVMLGSTASTGLPANLFAAGEARWLGVQIEGQHEQPRVMLLSVPYALKAVDAETLGGLPASAFLLAQPLNTAPSLVPVSPASGSSSSLPPPATITGSGTTNFVPLWTGASTIGNSVVFQSGSGATAKVGVSTTTPATTLDVKGASTLRGLVALPASGTATAASGFNSQAQTFAASTFNSGTLAAANQTFELRSEPVGNNTATPSANFSLLFGANGGAPAETGLKISGKGIFTFAVGQTFPGTGTVTSVASGAGLTGGPITKTGTLSIASAGVTNAMLQHSSLTVPAGTGLTGGGLVSLGGSATALAVNPAVVPELATVNAFTNLNSITVNSTSPDLTVTNTSTGSTIGSGNGINVTVTASGAQAFAAQGGYEGFVGSNAPFPIVGFGNTYGVFGETLIDANFQPSIYGFASGTTQLTIGVEGLSPSPLGTGIYGVGTGGSSEGSTIAGSGSVGIWGDSSADMGVLGTVDEGNSIAGFNASEPFATGYFENDTTVSATAPVLTTVGGNFGGACMFDVSGDMFCSGSKSAVVPVDNGARKVALYAVESPKNWFEDFGSASLSNGSALIPLELTFAQTVNTASYHVFLTPNGDCKGLYVSQKGTGGFEVRELGGGTSNISFDYRIVAERRGYENIRMADKTQLFQKAAGLKRNRHPATPLRAPTLKRPQEPARTAVVRPVGAQALKTR